MPAIGITGGISTGKSTFTECLRQLLPEAQFFDADVAGRQVVDLEEVKRELRETFGPGVFSATGDLNREAVRAIVFQDAAKRGALEKFSIRGFAGNGAMKRTRTADLLNFSLQTFHSFMKPVVKSCATELLWSPVRPKSNSPTSCVG